MSVEAFKRRLDIVKERLGKAGIGCFLVGPSSTLKYLSGY